MVLGQVDLIGPTGGWSAAGGAGRDQSGDSQVGLGIGFAAHYRWFVSSGWKVEIQGSTRSARRFSTISSRLRRARFWAPAAARARRQQRSNDTRPYTRPPTPSAGPQRRHRTSPRLWGAEILIHPAATSRYSWMRPPSTSRRLTSRGLPCSDFRSPAPGSGTANARPRCGRCWLSWRT